VSSLARYILGMSAHARREAFVEHGVYRARSFTYGEIVERSCACAAWMQSQNLRGERVIIWMPPGAAWAVAFYGCILSGAIAVPIDAGFSEAFVARVREKTGARLVVTGDWGQDFPAAPQFQPVENARDDLAEIVFTSGTTAEPRGVTITHGNLLANLEPIEHEIARRHWMAAPFSPIRFVNAIPLSHLFGQVMGLFIPQFLGGTVIFPESQMPDAIAKMIRGRRVSVMVSVPQQLEALSVWAKQLAGMGEGGGVLARWWRHRRLHRALGWKMWAFIVGGAPLSPATEKLWRDWGYAVIQGYGLTETAPAIAITHPFRQRAAGSVGIRLAGVEARVAEDGEILVRGPNVSPGYYGEVPASGDGWLHTGDLGRFDDAGNLFVLGRKKDVIVAASGLNVYPEDVERALEAQPEIVEAAVVGKDLNGRATVHAVLVTRGDPSAAIARANATLEAHQRVQGFSVWPGAALPRTVSTKKLQRAAIADRVNGQVVAAPKVAMTAWQKFLADRGIPLGTSLEDSGLDSLDRVELVMLLEENPGDSDLHAIFQPAVAPEAHEPTWPSSRVAHAFRVVFRSAILFPLLRWYVKVEVRGAENLADLRAPFIVAANHTSFMDVPVILRALPRRLRGAIAPAMSPDHFRKPWQLELTRLCFNGFLLKPDANAVQGALHHAVHLANTGHAILIFPEGRLTPDGAIHPFRAGTAVMAERLQLPVVPMRIDGLYEVWPEHQRKPGNGTVRVRIGAPLKMNAGESAVEFTKRLEEVIRRVLSAES